MNGFLRTSGCMGRLRLASTLAAKPPASKPPKPASERPLIFFNIQLDPRYQILGWAADGAAGGRQFTASLRRARQAQSIEFDRAGVPMSDPAG